MFSLCGCPVDLASFTEKTTILPLDWSRVPIVNPAVCMRRSGLDYSVPLVISLSLNQHNTARNIGLTNLP